MLYIIFSAIEYEELKGMYGEHSELSPRHLKNTDEYAVSVELVNDSEFASIRDRLLTLQQRELNDEDFEEGGYIHGE